MVITAILYGFLGGVMGALTVTVFELVVRWLRERFTRVDCADYIKRIEAQIREEK